MLPLLLLMLSDILKDCANKCYLCAYAPGTYNNYDIFSTIELVWVIVKGGFGHHNTA